jgi:hypothetical protein
MGEIEGLQEMMTRRVEVLDARVAAITSHIVERLATAAVQDMQARYDFGKVLHSLRRGSAGSRTAGALRVLAERLGIDASALRRYARVSETITPREFAWMMRLRTARGTPLTWSHVELLAREKEGERRQALATVVAAEDLSVRALAARMAPRPE